MTANNNIHTQQALYLVWGAYGSRFDFGERIRADSSFQARKEYAQKHRVHVTEVAARRIEEGEVNDR